MPLGSSVSPALHMGLFSNESDPLTWGDSDVMFPGMQHYPESSTAQDVHLTGAAGGDLNSIYQTPHQYEGGPRDRLLTNRLNSSSLSTGYDTERSEGRVSRRPLSLNANALRPKFQPRKPIDHELFLRDCRIPAHGIRAQEDVFTRVSSRAGGSSNQSTGAQIDDEVEPELSGGLPYYPTYETAGAYEMHFGSSFNAIDGMLGAVRSPAETAVQTHALYPYVVAAHIDCYKVGAEPAEVKRMDEAALKHHHLQLKNNNLRASPEIKQELDSVMAGYLKMLVDLKEKVEESFNKEKKWCDEMYAKLRVLAPSLSPMEVITGYNAEGNREGNTSAGANEGSTSVIGDRMQESPYWKNRNGLMSEEAQRAQLMKEWLKSKHDRSEISQLRGQCIKKRKQGKHPQTAREVLVEWFERHCEWPYPSDEEKLKLAALSGLETRQINNWFINQRKRHWESHTKDQTNLQIAQELRAFRQVAQCEKVVVDTFYVPLDVLQPSHNDNCS